MLPSPFYMESPYSLIKQAVAINGGMTAIPDLRRRLPVVAVAPMTEFDPLRTVATSEKQTVSERSYSAVKQSEARTPPAR